MGHWIRRVLLYRQGVEGLRRGGIACTAPYSRGNSGQVQHTPKVSLMSASIIGTCASKGPSPAASLRSSSSSAARISSAAHCRWR